MDYTLFYPTALDEVDPHNDNIDVCVTLADGQQFTFVVATPENLNHLMEQDRLAYLRPGLPFVFVRELTDTNIRAVIDDLIKNNFELIHIYGS